MRPPTTILRRFMKTFAKNLAFLVVLFLVGGWLISAYMEVKASTEIFDGPEDVPPVDAVIVPGASVYRSGQLSPVLERRMETALALAFERPGVRLLLSGTNVPQGYSETRAMREYAIDRGFPAEKILVDDAGRSTFLTLLNCKTIFGLQRVALVSQDYHLPRALYIARRLGMEVYGLRVLREDGVQPVSGSGWNAREWFSRVKDFALVRVYRWFHAR
ncbi:MAG TPA: YdcF family protein [Fibrobacteria bacterium]|nr:YdcF family protein [Fibrobacteria bacterium]